MSDLERYTVTMPRDLFRSFDESIARKGYRNRSEALRDLVRAALVEEQWENPDESVAATMTLIYDHHTHDLSEKINAIQHVHGELVVSTLHVHLNHHNCLEVIVLRGLARDVRALADSLGSIKGVKHAQLALTTDGKDLH